ncbi:hypothetical protein ACHAXA_007425 [Cyclostephanos tholiformis]|uniref:Peptidase M48 domain-containing protein n=1 Tax=Cyclostephanos tholiformis TaxID=382380 RepID=A0ABD3SDN1_9STRA
MIIGRKKSPAALHVRAAVALRVSFVDLLATRNANASPATTAGAQPSMELVLHSFELADRTGAQAQALARDLRLLSQLNDLSTPPGEYILRDLDVTSDISYRSTVSLLLSKCILNNLTLLEHRITLASDSGRAAEPSVDTRHCYPVPITERSYHGRGGGDGVGADRRGKNHIHRDDAPPPPPTYILLGIGIPIAASICAYRSCLNDVPYTNRRRLLATSEYWEASMGHEQHASLLESYRGDILPDDHAASITVRRVGGRIADAAERCTMEWSADGRGTTTTTTTTTGGGGGRIGRPPIPRPYTYTVVRSPDANAFVLPGNHVYVLTGLFRYVRDEDDLASILGHEMAHNLARHAGERMSSSVLSAMARRLSLIIDPSGMLLALLLPAEALLYTLPHSREHEMEADRIGIMLSSEACYDPRAASRVFARMREDDGRGGGSAAAAAAAAEWISTHPGYESRLSQLDKWMPNALERYHGGGRCASIREGMERARVFAAGGHAR